MKLYNPDLIYLLIPVGGIVAAMVIWTVDRVLPWSRAERRAARDALLEAPQGADGAVRAAPEVSGLR
jgi:hypothetical protein